MGRWLEWTGEREQAGGRPVLGERTVEGLWQVERGQAVYRPGVSGCGRRGLPRKQSRVFKVFGASMNEWWWAERPGSALNLLAPMGSLDWAAQVSWNWGTPGAAAGVVGDRERGPLLVLLPGSVTPSEPRSPRSLSRVLPVGECSPDGHPVPSTRSSTQRAAAPLPASHTSSSCTRTGRSWRTRPHSSATT